MITSFVMHWSSHHREIFIIVLSQFALIFLLGQKGILHFIAQILVILILIGGQTLEYYVRIRKCTCNVHVKIYDAHKIEVLVKYF